MTLGLARWPSARATLSIRSTSLVRIPDGHPDPGLPDLVRPAPHDAEDSPGFVSALSDYSLSEPDCLPLTFFSCADMYERRSWPRAARSQA
ncbi:hypothetical protein GCM10009603_63230 [Nocardiopsis exhalans]